MPLVEMTDDERTALDEASRAARPVREWPRSWAVGPPASGRGAGEVAQVLDCSVSSVYDWAADWREQKAALAAYVTARAAYAEASPRANLCVATSWLSLLTVPGLLYARDPSLLGGPLGGLFRWLAKRGMRYRARRRHPVNVYQGVGFVLLGIAIAAYAFSGYVPKLFINAPIGSSASAAAVWLIMFPGFLSLPLVMVSVPLTLGVPLAFAFWGGRADMHDRGIEPARADE